MKEASIVRDLVSLIPYKFRNYADTTLDKRQEEIDLYLHQHDLKLEEFDQEKVLLSTFLNWFDSVFIDSEHGYSKSLNFMREREVHSIRIGSNEYSSGDRLSQEWKQLSTEFARMRLQLGLPNGSSVPDIIRNLLETEPR